MLLGCQWLLVSDFATEKSDLFLLVKVELVLGRHGQRWSDVAEMWRSEMRLRTEVLAGVTELGEFLESF